MQNDTASAIEGYNNGFDGDLFDWSLFGALIRNMRKKRGYPKAENFSEAIYNRTRFSVSSDTLYKIESGKQAPSSMQLFAIALALGLGFDDLRDKIFSVCASDEWKGVSNGDIPLTWKWENTANKTADVLGEPYSVIPADSNFDDIAMANGIFLDRSDAYRYSPDYVPF